jgi:hypothetical protein
MMQAFAFVHVRISAFPRSCVPALRPSRRLFLLMVVIAAMAPTPVLGQENT